jgi:TRAP-type C4-dicarboxylate transport system permease small subunit
VVTCRPIRTALDAASGEWLNDIDDAPARTETVGLPAGRTSAWRPFMSEFSRLLPDEPLPQRISRILAWLGGAIVLFGCSFLITIDVVTRFFFKRGMVESFEVSGYALAACIGLGLAFTVTSKANIRVDILLDALPDRVRVICDLVASLVLALIAVALAWFAFGTLSQSWALGAKSVSLLQVPMVIPQGVWFAGIFWFACMAVLIPIQAVMRLLARDRAGFDALIGSLRVAEEIEQSGVEQSAAGTDR